MGTRVSSALALVLVLLARGSASAQTPQSYPLESATGLRLHNVAAEPATLDGKKGLRLTLAPGASPAGEQLAVVDGAEFTSGVIEAEIAGAPAASAAEGARGFVGIAFRLHRDRKRTTRSTCVRPMVAPRIRSDETTRRSTSRIPSGRGTGCARRRRAGTSPTSTCCRGMDQDTHRGTWRPRAPLRPRQRQPTLIVNDVKTGASAKGALALWLGPGTVAHFRNLTVRTAADAR